jgi:hypothetical protein
MCNNRVFLTSLISVIVVSSSAFADDFSVVREGQKQDVIGTWHFEGHAGRIEGRADMQGPQGRITYGFRGLIAIPNIDVIDFDRSDGQHCRYTGQFDNDGWIRGTATCIGITVPFVAKFR